MLFDNQWAKSILEDTPSDVVSIANRTVANEGGYVNNSNDKGGPTNHGVTLVTARRYGLSFDYDHDGDVTSKDIRAITTDIAAAFFILEYFTKPRLSMLPSCLWPVMIDIAVNSGPTEAIILTQRAAVSLGATITPDGIVGPHTALVCSNLTANGCSSLINAICSERIVFYRRLVAENPQDKIFLNGWIHRSNTYIV